jgi:uncharacterized protein (UPF0261 family)
VISVGALDMVNFGAIETVPVQYEHRKLHVHNSQVTLMRTNVDENIKIGEWIARKLNNSTSPLRLLIPEGGFSLLDQPSGPFYDPEADQALIHTLKSSIKQTPDRVIECHPLSINSAEFAQKLLDAFFDLTGGPAK